MINEIKKDLRVQLEYIQSTKIDGVFLSGADTLALLDYIESLEPKMTWATNALDPKSEEFKTRYLFDSKGRNQELEFIGKYIIGDPKATFAHSVEELKEMGWIGLYKPG